MHPHLFHPHNRSSAATTNRAHRSRTTWRTYASARGIVVEAQIAVGHPADQILQFASDGPVDLIVIGQRGRSRIQEWITGSTSRRLVERAHCPVLVVRIR
ncbi:MAG: universal stress protein [Vicinamibacterales bacterium]